MGLDKRSPGFILNNENDEIVGHKKRLKSAIFWLSMKAALSAVFDFLDACLEGSLKSQ